jgi:hypothetical protein
MSPRDPHSRYGRGTGRRGINASYHPERAKDPLCPSHPEKRPQSIVLRIPGDWLPIINESAKARGWSRNRFLCEIIAANAESIGISLWHEQRHRAS